MMKVLRLALFLILLLSIICDHRGIIEGKIWKKPSSSFQSPSARNMKYSMGNRKEFENEFVQDDYRDTQRPSTMTNNEEYEEAEHLVDTFTRSFASRLVVAASSAGASLVLSYFLMNVRYSSVLPDLIVIYFV